MEKGGARFVHSKEEIQWLTTLKLTFQNSALILIMHYSRVMPPVGGHRYFTSTAVFLNEVFKLAISLSMSLHDLSNDVSSSAPVTTLVSELFSQVFTGDSWSMAIPAVLYTLQNTLQYVAVSNLDAATFQVTYQLKILATALFSVTMLGRRLTISKWLSLVMLTAGVAVVQMPGGEQVLTLKDLKDGNTGWSLPRSLEDMRDLGNVAAGQLLSKRSATYEGIEEDFKMHNPQQNPTVGLVAVIMACVISGVAGVYFEKVLKQSNTKASVWIRNVQLSFYSLFPALFIGVMFKDGADIEKYGFFAGYSWIVWTAISCQAIGGVFVSLVVNYADNIAKNFATSISIILSFLVSVIFFNIPITFKFVAGTAIVLGATYLYSQPEGSQRLAQGSSAAVEKSMLADSYFGIDLKQGPRLEIPQKMAAQSSSIPTTPIYERKHGASRSGDLKHTKHDE